MWRAKYFHLHRSLKRHKTGNFEGLTDVPVGSINNTSSPLSPRRRWFSRKSTSKERDGSIVRLPFASLWVFGASNNVFIGCGQVVPIGNRGISFAGSC